MYLEKVTAFVLRTGPAGPQLLIFRHPTAGYQLPAGTVEEGEPPEKTVVREVAEEAGLAARLIRKIGIEERPAPEEWGVLRYPTTALRLSPGIDAQAAEVGLARHWVRLEEQQAGFWRICCQECDLNQDPPQLLWEQRGWVREDELASGTRRHFFLLEPIVESPDEWDQLADQGHLFHMQWTPVSQLPALIGEQNDWLKWLPGCFSAE